MSGWSPGPAWLFCPADRPERYPKALAVADVVIVDLEDAVAPAAKDAAREALTDLARRGALDLDRTVVRVNPTGTADHRADLAVTTATGVRRVLVAKAEDAAAVAAVPHEVIALAETARGIQAVDALAAADNVVGLMWGADDLVASLGGTASRRPDGTLREVPRFARSRVLLAAKACDRLALDGVHLDLDDVNGLAAECADAAAVGFDAYVAIHPRQVPVVRAAYRPDPERVAWARALLELASTGPGVAVFRGRMVDGPVFRQAERILQRDRSAGGP